MRFKTYAEKLRDPRWQRRRLEILNRSNFTCEECGADDLTLNVHHKLYRKGADPWEYADAELQALCEDCHKAHHSIDEAVSKALSELSAGEIEQVLGYARGLTARAQVQIPDETEEPVDLSTLQFEISTEEYGAGFFDALWIEYLQQTLEEVIASPPLTGIDLWGLHVDHTIARVRRLRAKSAS